MKSSSYALVALLGTMASGFLAFGLGGGGAARSPEQLLASRPALTRYPRASRLLVYDPRRRLPASPAPVEAARPSPSLATTWGPLGLFPYDAEYNCEIPSENPGAAAMPADFAFIVAIPDQADETDVTTVDDASAAAESRQDEDDWMAAEAEQLAGPAGLAPDRSSDRYAEASETATPESATPETDSSAGVVPGESAASEEATSDWEPLPFRVLGWGDLAEADADRPSAAQTPCDEEVPAAAAEPTSVRPDWLRRLGRTLIEYGEWLEGAGGA